MMLVRLIQKQVTLGRGTSGICRTTLQTAMTKSSKKIFYGLESLMITTPCCAVNFKVRVGSRMTKLCVARLRHPLGAVAILVAITQHCPGKAAAVEAVSLPLSDQRQCEVKVKLC